MNEANEKFFMESYTLEHTKRYSMKPVILQESVATHSYFVALAVMLLRADYKFDVDKAIKIALCHDLPEMYISDVNHLVKKQFPNVAKALKDAEYQIAEDMIPYRLSHYVRDYHDDSPEALAVHYADALQCKQYADNEIQLGNQGYMTDVYRNSVKRLYELESKLQPYKVHP